MRGMRRERKRKEDRRCIVPELALTGFEIPRSSISQNGLEQDSAPQAAVPIVLMDTRARIRMHQDSDNPLGVVDLMVKLTDAIGTISHRNLCS